MSRVIVALDVPSLEQARALAVDLDEHVAGFKVGLELLTAEGPTAIEAIAAVGKPVFADAKLHDIPNTVGRAAAQIADAGARWVTVHASGGREMMEAANRAMGQRGVLAVTVLTSLDAAGLASVGVGASVADQAVMLSALASAAGVEGIVCSPSEASLVRSAQPDLVIFTPGVRPTGSIRNDQRRVSTPAEAIVAGSDYLVIGRPITAAANPVTAAREIASSIARVG